MIAKQLFNYLGSLVFLGLPVWLLFMTKIVSFNDKFLSLLLGIITVIAATYIGQRITEYYREKKGGSLQPVPILENKIKYIFMSVAVVIWIIVVLTNG